jgi:hypothetical protein
MRCQYRTYPPCRRAAAVHFNVVKEGEPERSLDFCQPHADSVRAELLFFRRSFAEGPAPKGESNEERQARINRRRAAEARGSL